MSDARLRKFRYEYPRFEAHFVESPSPEAVVQFLQRTYPHNFDDVLPTMVEIPAWPAFWKTLDEDGRVRLRHGSE
ncbi:MAG: hypothetical protein B7733_03375 [Myxococcales bacterium FL481]|nr:MAG: hypothetical protein B7733_03375 [Myxococcales bacterium FL481]